MQKAPIRMPKARPRSFENHVEIIRIDGGYTKEIEKPM